jgi:hypothetical protein
MPQESEEGRCSYLGRSSDPRVGSEEVSRGHSTRKQASRIREPEVSQFGEGLNIRMFQIHQGGLASPVLSGTEQGSNNCKMIEQVLNRNNLMRAYRRVMSNKGSAGIDGMTVKGLYNHLLKNREGMETQLRRGTYLPQAILGVEIPKSNGRSRLLGIPVVSDRFLQQAAGQVIAARFEMDFSDSSYGFRPNRNAQQAVLKAQEYINSGYNHIVDIDLENFFDEVDHCILLQLLYRKVKCPLTLRLIRKVATCPDTNKRETGQAQERCTAG